MKSDFRSVILWKYYAGFLLLVFALSTVHITVHGNEFRWGSLIVFIPAITASIFHLSLAEFKLNNGTIYYKRFWHWTGFEKDEVLASGFLFFHIGYVKLKQFVFPWGKLYFILDTKPNRNFPNKIQFPILNYLKSSALPSKASIDEAPPQNNGILLLKLVGTAIGGAFLCWYYTWINQMYPIHPDRLGVGKWIILSQIKLFQAAGDVRVISVLFLVFIFLVTYRSHRRDAWVWALATGATVERILVLLKNSVLK